MHALETLATGQPRRVVYGQGGPVDIVLPCGGSVEILLEPIDAANLAVENLLDLHARRLPAMWLTNGSEQECLAPGEATSSPITLRGSQALCGEPGPGDDGFIYRRHDPRRRLIVVGSDPICLALIDITRAMEFDVVLLRPKGPPSPPPNFAGQYMTSPAALALDAIGLDAWTSVVVATHDPINDHDALLAALPSAAGYVGLLGARRRLKEKLAELSNAGVADRDLQRLNAPIGLDIGGRSPWDIAISILGQVIQNANAAEKSFVWP